MTTPLRPCPTPNKIPYQTPGLAMAGFINSPAERQHRAYRCRCGSYHLTSNPPWGQRK